MKTQDYTFNTPKDVAGAFWEGNQALFNQLGKAKYADVLREEWHDFLDMLSNDNHASSDVLAEANKTFHEMHAFLYS
tara:strand:+ start:243 stop:473 length:231 start_codon:yes stop_codon:yes gene_type:complete